MTRQTAEAGGRQRSTLAAVGRLRSGTDLVLLLPNGIVAGSDPARLRLGSGVGEGAFASVHTGELRPAPGAALPGSPVDAPRLVAVKVLHQRLIGDLKQVKLLVQEAELLRRLRHRNIVEFVGCSRQTASISASGGDHVDGGCHPSRPPTLSKASVEQLYFFAQEYCGGGSLGELLRRQMVKPFKQLYSNVDALRWSLHIARALHYLHEMQPAIIHRDLKLDNVVLTSADVASAEAKLVDFGLACHVGPAWVAGNTAVPPPQPTAASLPCDTHPVAFPKAVSLSLSSCSSTVDAKLDGACSCAARGLTGRTGSLGYMAPEVYTSSQPYGPSVDIFSLGMCIYNLFARSIPSLEMVLNSPSQGSVRDPMELFAAKVAGGYRPPLPSYMPPAVARVIEACWKGKPELRPSARSVVQLLESICSSGQLGGGVQDTRVQSCNCGCAIM